MQQGDRSRRNEHGAVRNDIVARTFECACHVHIFAAEGPEQTQAIEIGNQSERAKGERQYGRGRHAGLNLDDHADGDANAQQQDKQPLEQGRARLPPFRPAKRVEADGIDQRIASMPVASAIRAVEPATMPAPNSTKNMMALIASMMISNLR
nr:hypothetical protein [Sphingobium sp. DC-2]